MAVCNNSVSNLRQWIPIHKYLLSCKGALKILEVWKGDPKKYHANFTPENLSENDFLWGWGLFSLGEKGGALKKIAIQKGALKIFRAENCLHQAPLQMFVNGP